MLHPVLHCHGTGTSRGGTRSLSVPAVTPRSKTPRKPSGSSQGHSLPLTARAEPIHGGKKIPQIRLDVVRREVGMQG